MDLDSNLEGEPNAERMHSGTQSTHGMRYN